jgi:hypothetical protein
LRRQRFIAHDSSVAAPGQERAPWRTYSAQKNPPLYGSGRRCISVVKGWPGWRPAADIKHEPHDSDMKSIGTSHAWARRVGVCRITTRAPEQSPRRSGLGSGILANDFSAVWRSLACGGACGASARRLSSELIALFRPGSESDQSAALPRNDAMGQQETWRSLAIEMSVIISHR